MTVRFYLLPIITILTGPPGEEDYPNRGPKYLTWWPNEDGLTNQWNMKPYGAMDVGLVAVDLNPAKHITLAGYSDTVALPFDLDQTISSGALSAVQGSLETLNIPGGWVATSHTYREIARQTAHLFMLAQRYNATSRGKKLVPDGTDMDMLVSDIPQQRRDDIEDAAQSCGYDISAIVGSWKVRQVLRYLGNQWGDDPVLFGKFGLL